MSRFGNFVILGLVVAAFALPSAYDAIRVTRKAPDFTLTSTGYENGTQGDPVTFSLSDYAGKTVVLDMMAVACDSCRYVTRDVLVPLHKRLANDTDLVILSIDAWADNGTGSAIGGETTATLVQQQKDDGVPWRHALDTDDVWIKYSALSLPRVVVVSGSGDIVFDELGKPNLERVERVVRASLAQSAAPVPTLNLGLYGIAAVAGAASLLSPCSVGLMPAYFAVLLDDARRAGTRPVARALRGGLAAAFGIILVYAVLAVLLGLAGGFVRGIVGSMSLVAGGAMLVAGMWAASGRGVPWLGRLAGWGPQGQTGLFAFGIAYAVAGFACSGPLFLPILLAGFDVGPASGLLLFLLYAASIAVVTLAVAALVAAGAEGPLRRLMRHARVVQIASGLLLAGAGAYVAWYALS